MEEMNPTVLFLSIITSILVWKHNRLKSYIILLLRWNSPQTEVAAIVNSASQDSLLAVLSQDALLALSLMCWL
jgi:hypothetical protein